MAETLSDNQLRNVEAGALVDALADTLLEVELETLRNTLADVMPKALIHALADTLAEVKTEKLSKTLSSGRHAGLDGSRVGGRDTWRHVGLCGDRGTGRHTS